MTPTTCSWPGSGSGRAGPGRSANAAPEPAAIVAAASSEATTQVIFTFPEPVTTDRITLLQAQKPANRWITSVELSFDRSERAVDDPDAGAPLGGGSRPVALGEASRQAPGQEIRFPTRTFPRCGSPSPALTMP